MDDVTLWVFFDPGPDPLPFACDAKSPSRFRPVRRLARLGSDRATYDGVFVGGVGSGNLCGLCQNSLELQ